jgi:Reverse transcriptase (RNA-dependent DNA polymerase)
LISDPEQVANIINNFFTEVGSTKDRQTNQFLDLEFEMRSQPITKLTKFDHTTQAEVREIIKSLDNNRAMGADQIPSKFLKDNITPLSELLSRFINESFDQGKFPNTLKFARVTPLYKSEDPTDVGNYRPLSILSSISKVFETVIKNRLSKHLATNKIIHPNQYGFLKNSSTTSAASCLVNGIV